MTVKQSKKPKVKARENRIEFYFPSEEQQWTGRNREEPKYAPHYRSEWNGMTGEISVCRNGFEDKGLEFPRFPFSIVITDMEPSDDLCLKCERWDMDYNVYRFFRLRKPIEEFGTDEIEFWWWVEEEVEE